MSGVNNASDVPCLRMLVCVLLFAVCCVVKHTISSRHHVVHCLSCPRYCFLYLLIVQANEAIQQASKQSINQSIKQAIKQAIKQSINQSSKRTSKRTKAGNDDTRGQRTRQGYLLFVVCYSLPCVRVRVQGVGWLAT
jgi:hypothetical protein